MRQVDVVIAARDHSPDEVFATISDYSRYSELTDAVLGVDVTRLEGGRDRCTWEVKFRRGILIWTEEGVTDPDRRRIEFSLVSGDLDHLVGHWQVDEIGHGSAITFHCEFDMGIPTLEHLIEPIAADTLRDNIVNMCEGLFGDVDVLPQTPGGIACAEPQAPGGTACAEPQAPGGTACAEPQAPGETALVAGG